MLPSPPLLYFSIAAADQPFATQLAGRLQQRGLAVQLSTALPPHTPAAAYLQGCVACFVVISPASNATPAIQQEWQQALALGKPVIPLIMQAKSDMVAALQQFQWIDFSESAETGWLDLLMTLNTLGIARFPQPAVPFLDWELALARAYRGRMPYTWHAYRIDENYYRTISQASVRTALTFIPSFFLVTGWLIQTFQQKLTLFAERGFQAGLVALGIASGIGLGIRAIWPLVRQSRRNQALVTDRTEIVITTPEGFGVRTRAQTVVVQFRDIAAITRLPDRPDFAAAPPPRARSLQGALSEQLVHMNSPEYMTNLADQTHNLLEVRFHDGRTTVVALGTRFPSPAIIMQQIITEFQRSRAKAGPGVAPNGQAKRVFISYARRDQVEVDQIDMALQQNGLQTWVDRNMLTGGQAWSRELQQAIDACTALVVCISPHALASPVVPQEYNYALQRGKPVIALRLQGGGAIPPVLQPRLRADFAHGATQSLRQGLAPLLLALAEVGVVGETPTAFNPMLVLARTLAGRAEPTWHSYRSHPIWRSGGIILAFLLALVPLALAPLIFSLTAGNLWYTTGTALLSALFLNALLPALRRRSQQPPLVITTPAGFVEAKMGTLRSYSYADYAAATIAPQADYQQRILRGMLLLTVRATGQTLPVSRFDIYPQGHLIVQQIGADLRKYWSQ